MQHARQLKVGGEVRLPGHLVLGIEPGKRFSYYILVTQLSISLATDKSPLSYLLNAVKGGKVRGILL